MLTAKQDIQYPYDLDEIKATLTRNCLWPEALAKYPQLQEALSKPGQHCECPFHGGEDKDGFRIFKDALTPSPEKPQIAICNTCGAFTPIDLILKLEGKPVIDLPIIKMLADVAGITANDTTVTPVAHIVKKAPAKEDASPPAINKYFHVYQKGLAKVATGSPAARYLEHRGIGDAVGKFTKALRQHGGDTFYHSKLTLEGVKCPALVALIRNLAGDVIGVQRIYLDNHGRKLKVVHDTKEDRLYLEEDGGVLTEHEKRLDCKKLLTKKKEAGALSGGSVQFGKPGLVLFIAEGIETATAVAIATEQITWSAVQTAMMGKMEVPDSVQTVVIFADKDANEAGRKAAEKLAERLTRDGKEVSILYPPMAIADGQKGVDWLDAYNEFGKDCLIKSVENLPGPYRCEVADTPPTKADKKPVMPTDSRPHSVRYPPELVVPECEHLSREEAVERLNRHFVHIVQNGKNYVIRTGRDQKDNKMAELFKLDEFKNLLLKWPKVFIGFDTNGNKKMANANKVWLEHKDANVSYSGLTFFPKDVDYYQGRLNTYYGFGMEPIACEEDDIRLWLDHVKNIICSGNQEHFDYLMNWCAHMVQVPEEKPGVAVILKAGQGTGKGTFADPLGQIIGSHYQYADSPNLLTGRFNGAMENKILVFADEAFFGSKEATDRMKAKITERYTTIERKGIDVISVPDFARIVMASNKENLVRIETDERRYLFLEVSEEHKQDLGYFKPLREQINNGYLAPRLLHYLLNRDISAFVPQDVPKTKALLEQKLDNLEPVDRFILHMLYDGAVTVDAEAWPVRLPRKDVQQSCEAWIEDRKLKVFGSLERKLGHKLTVIGVSSERVRRDGPAPYDYIFPSLNDARTKFEKYIGAEIDW